MALKSILIGFSLTVLSALQVANAQDESLYEAGHGALQKFGSSAGIAATQLWVQIWLVILGICLLSSVFFVKRHAVARWVIGGIIVSIPLTPVLVRSLGFPFLGGAIALGHLIFWMPAFLMLIFQRPFLDESHSKQFRIWSGAMTAAYAFSFIFDIRDTYIYLGHVLG